MKPTKKVKRQEVGSVIRRVIEGGEPEQSTLCAHIEIPQ
jgi:hypothetical protein